MHLTSRFAVVVWWTEDVGSLTETMRDANRREVCSGSQTADHAQG